MGRKYSLANEVILELCIFEESAYEELSPIA
jgi:hypothetical protein